MGKVLVVGDVTLDWLELDVPRSEPKEEADLKNYQLCAGFRWTPVWGGAKLLERLVEAAIVEAEGELEMHQKTTIERIGLPEAGTDRSRCYLQSLAIIKSMIADKDKAIRVEKFKGFTKGVDKLAVAGVPTGIGAVDCLVLDDAANGCRWDDEFLKGVKEVGANARLVIVKLSRPLDSSSLVEALPKTDNGRRVVIIVNADDLRAQGVDISRRLSWERTALDVVSASRASPLLGRLTRHGDVMVRLGSDGCIVLMFDGGKHLTFDPRGAEGGFEHDLEGTMPGATSAFVAAITAALLREASPAALLKAVPVALSASRQLLKCGFVEELDKLDYPRRVFHSPSVGDFSTIQLPTGDGVDLNWSILEERLKSDPGISPYKIARDGPDRSLASVPIARYNDLRLVDRREVEGYRSIENLLREYRDSVRGGEKMKPLSVAVFGPPGAGKSFGIKQIAEAVGGKQIKAETFNLTQLEGPHDLVGAFHIARDAALGGIIPLLVFDEFDCSYNSEPWGWLKYFLAPMQDGSFKEEGYLHPLGAAIFVFAGGTAETFAEFKAAEEKQETAFKSAKGPDFLSRLKGFVDIQGINMGKSETPPDSICCTRRAILLHAFLSGQKTRTENLFPVVEKHRRLEIDDAVLEALLRVTKYVHGARSLETILSMSRLAGSSRFSVASLPSDAQLALHVNGSFTDIIRDAAKKR